MKQAIENFRQRASRFANTIGTIAATMIWRLRRKSLRNAFGSLFRAFALNLCPAVCDAVKDKLRITGFGAVPQPRHRSGATPPVQEASFTSDVDRIWDANRMGIRAGEIHKEALRNGNAYLVVWPDDDGKRRDVSQPS